MSMFAQDSPGLCLLPSVIIFHAPFHLQKCLHSDDKSQGPPDPGHREEEMLEWP